MEKTSGKNSRAIKGRKAQRGRVAKTSVFNDSICVEIAKEFILKINVQVIDNQYFFYDDTALEVLAPSIRKTALNMLHDTLAKKYGFTEVESLF